MEVNTMNIAQVIQPSKTDLPSLFTFRAPAHTPSPEVGRGDKAGVIIRYTRTVSPIDIAGDAS